MPPQIYFCPPPQLRYPGAGPASVAYKLIFVILLYLPSCFGQETAKEPFGLQFKLPRLVYHTLRSLHAVLFLLNAKQGIEHRSSISVTDTRSLIGANIFFLHPTKPSLPNSHHNTLDWPYVMFFCEEGRKKFTLKLSKRQYYFS